jgi:hypothetical protein
MELMRRLFLGLFGKVLLDERWRRFVAHGRCWCGHVGRWVRDPDVPIGFNAATNEYYLETRSPGKIRLRYCCFCGGKLSESTQDILFMKSDPAEVKDIQRKLARISSEADIVPVLGPATCVFPHVWSPGEVFLDPETRWEKQYNFDGLYRTIVVLIQVYPDGRLFKVHHAKPKRRRRPANVTP